MNDLRDISGEMRDGLWNFRPKIRVLGDSRYWVHIDARKLSSDMHPTLLFDMCLDLISQHIQKYKTKKDYITYILENFVISKMSSDNNMRTIKEKNLETITMSDCFFRDVQFKKCKFDEVSFVNCMFQDRLNFSKCIFNDVIIDFIADDGGVVVFQERDNTVMEDDFPGILVSGRTPVKLENLCK